MTGKVDYIQELRSPRCCRAFGDGVLSIQPHVGSSLSFSVSTTSNWHPQFGSDGFSLGVSYPGSLSHTRKICRSVRDVGHSVDRCPSAHPPF